MSESWRSYQQSCWYLVSRHPWQLPLLKQPLLVPFSAPMDYPYKESGWKRKTLQRVDGQPAGTLTAPIGRMAGLTLLWGRATPTISELGVALGRPPTRVAIRPAFPGISSACNVTAQPYAMTPR